MKIYQLGIISHLLELRQPIGTGDMHAHLEGTGLVVCRASVINYLQLLDAEGIITSEGRTGKGGRRKVYSKKLNFEEILTHMANSVLDTILAAFPRSEYIKYLKSK